MFCPNCGSPLGGNRICSNCGSAATATMPPVQLAPKPGKSKSTAVLLAVFLGFWTFLYSYRVDKAKFWLGLIFSLCALASAFVFAVAFIQYSGTLSAVGLDSFVYYLSDRVAGSPASRGGNEWAKQFFPLANWSLLATLVSGSISWLFPLIRTTTRPSSFFEKL